MRPAPQGATPLWLRLVAWLARMAFLVALLAWLGRSFVLLMDGEKGAYAAFQQGLIIVPDTLTLMWRVILDFIAPLRERLFPAQPVFIGPELVTPQSPSAAAPSSQTLSFSVSPSVVQSCLLIAGAQVAVTLWVLTARRDAARMWDGPGTLTVLEPRARVIFYLLPLAIAGFETYRAWQTSAGDAVLIGTFILLVRLFPWLTGLPFWIAEEVIGLDFAALGTLRMPSRLRRVPTAVCPLTDHAPSSQAAPPALPDYETALNMFGLKPDCTAEDAMEAYRAHMRVHHAGRGGSNEYLKQLNAAFERIKRVRGWA